jgi:hypothetical protein
MVGILIIIGHGDVYRRLIKWIKAKVKFETKAVGPKVVLVLVSDSPCKMMQTMRRLCSKTKGEFCFSFHAPLFTFVSCFSVCSFSSTCCYYLYQLVRNMINGGKVKIIIKRKEI